jgi:hypothetical protein
MPRKLQACQECKNPCHGTRCSPCAHAQPGGTGFGHSHPSVNSVGEFNASGGFSGQAGIVFPKRIDPKESGWVGKDRDELREWVEANRRRMTQGSGANWRPDAASQVWSF